MLSQHPISGAPIAGTDDSGTSGPQTYQLSIEEGIGFLDYVAERVPDTFDDSIEESIGFEDLNKNAFVFKLSGVPDGEGRISFSIMLLPTEEKPAPSVTIYWGDGSNDVISSSAYDTWDWVYTTYVGSGPFTITMTGDLDCVTGWKTSVIEVWSDPYPSTLSFRLQDLSSLENLIELGAHQVAGLGSTMTGVLGDLLDFPNLQSFYLENLSTLTGDLTLLNSFTNVTGFYIEGADLSYTPGLLPTYINFALPFGQFPGCRDCGLTATEVSNIVIDLNAAGCSLGNFDLTSNGFITSDGLAARAELVGRGFFIWVDGVAEVDDAGLIFSDYSVWNFGYQKIIAETIMIFDAPGFGFHLQIAESLGVAEQIKEILAVLANDFLMLDPCLFSTWKGSLATGSGISLTETSSFGKMYADLIAEGMGLADITSFSFQLLILDSLVCNSAVEAAALFQRQLAEALSLTDSALRAWESLVSDAFNVVESASFIYGVMATVQESVGLAGASSYLLFANEGVNESLHFQSSIGMRSILGAIIQDALGLFCSVLIDGEVWECWVLNTNKFHPSVYSGFDFNSYAISEGRAYGAKEDGIYELTGDNDSSSSIRSGVAFPETDFGTVSEKRFRKAYLGIAGGSPVLKVENENDYGFYGIENDKTTINRSLHGERWAFSILDFDELEFVELIPVVLSRRRG